jgi:transposase
MKPATLEQKSTLYVSMELSDARWRLSMCASGERKVRRRVVKAEDLEGLFLEIEQSKRRLGLPAEAEVVSCYEAGRYGFVLHRALTARGWRNVVVNPSSLRVSRQGRRAKTDRLDADLLLRSLVRYEQGEEGEWTVVRVPSVEVEDEREPQRELDSLRIAANRERNQIEGLLLKSLGKKVAAVRVQKQGLGKLETLTGEALPERLRSRIGRALERLAAIEGQMREIRKAREERLREARARLRAGEPVDEVAARVLRLETLGCVGTTTSWLLVTELFAWRQLRNRRQVGRLVGLTGTPYDSGESSREQGIVKAGNRRVRRLIVEIAWLWVRYQPDSALTLWYRRRFLESRRHRRVGITALARRLLIALWRFCEQGIVPAGATLKPGVAAAR